MSCDASKITRFAFLWTRIARTPLWAMYSLLPFFLLKELEANAFQVALMVALKPSVSILSMYWASWVNQRSDRLVGNLIWASLIGALPFFCFPFISNSWFYIFTFGLYMFLHRGSIPAWMEIMKQNLGAKEREKTFALGSTLGYVGDAAVPLLLCGILENYQGSWRWIFPLFALFSLSSLFVLRRIPILTGTFIKEKSLSLWSHFLDPWKNARNLLKQRPDFRMFQIAFMFGGGGLMVIQAILPAYFMNVLDLSYTELALAFTVCKGVGFALTSRFWANYLGRVNIFRFGAIVPIFAAFFALFLIFGQYAMGWVYAAYLFYGVMQAGSELCWNLSGPIFSNKEDSSLYSSVNVVSVGVRGFFAPGLGALIAFLSSPVYVLLLGAFFCLIASATMRFGENQYGLSRNRLA